MADHRLPLARDVPQPIPVPRLVLARDQSEVPAGRLGIPEAIRVVDEGGHRLGRTDAHAGDASQQEHGGRVFRLLICYRVAPPPDAQQFILRSH